MVSETGKHRSDFGSSTLNPQSTIQGEDLFLAARDLQTACSVSTLNVHSVHPLHTALFAEPKAAWDGLLVFPSASRLLLLGCKVPGKAETGSYSSVYTLME